jgi:hypothetical protein
MQSDLWAWLLRRVPAEQHNQLMLVTRSGTEIAVQSLLRVESELIAIKGRLAGSQDAGRVYFIPYSNIDYLGIQRDVKETEFDAIFGTSSLMEQAGIRSSAPPAAMIHQQPANVAHEAPVSTSVSISQKTPLPLKSEVLERFRSRIAGASASHNGTNLRPVDG